MNKSPFVTERDIKNFDFSPWGGLEGFLKATSNGATANNKGMALKRLVPDLSRAVDMTATAISSLPFTFLNEAGEIIDSSEDWKNKLGGFDDPKRLIYLIASSLCGGAAYVLPFRTPKLIYDLQYLVPHSITPFINRDGLVYFDRVTDTGLVERYNPKDLIYFWLPDSDVEVGAALNTPLGNAMQDAELILNSKNTMRVYGERGFVPITLLGAKGMVNEAERQKAEGFFDRLLKGGFDVLAKIVNSEALSLIKVGAGMEELKGSYIEILRESTESIAKSFGIPSAMFMSDNAFASEFDALTRQWYTTSRFRSIYQTIEGVFSQQLLKPYGARMMFNLDELDIFQDDEQARASSVTSYVSAIDKSPKISKLVMGFMGVDMTEEEKADFEKIISEAETDKEEAKENIQGDEETDEPLSPDEMKDLSTWYSKAIAWHRKQKSAVDWDSKHLREDVASVIRTRLSGAKTLEDIKAAFVITPEKTEMLFSPQVQAIKELADAINNSVEKG